METKLNSTVNGTVISIESVADPVFAEKMLGDGIAVRPPKELQTVVAPTDGTIVNVSETFHAVAMSLADKHELIIHIGIDTVNLKGEGFKALVKNGDKVKAGQKLIEVDFAKIADKVPSIDVITVITNMSDNETIKKVDKSTVSANEFLMSVVGEDGIDNSEDEDTHEAEIVSPPCTVLNKTGIHARPALHISQIAAKYPVVRLRKDNTTVSAKSITALMSLNAKYLDQLQIIATGVEAQNAINELTEAFANGLGEEVGKKPTATVQPAQKEDVIKDFSKTVDLTGIVASPGFVIGKSYLYQQADLEIAENTADSTDNQTLLNDSIHQVALCIKADIDEAIKNKLATKADIYRAHLGILKDESIVDEAAKLIKAGKSAAYAWRKATKTSIDVLSQIDNPLIKERILDFKDVERRVIRSILGLEDEKFSFPDKTIVVAQDLVPSDLAKFQNVTGYILANGSATSHVSLIIQNTGTPAVVSVGSSALHISNDTDLILDASKAKITVNPTPAFLIEMQKKRKELEAVRKRNIENSNLPAVTTDGVRIEVKGNISNAEESRKASGLGAEGVGLFRTEFMFLNTSTPPDAETHRKLYQEVVDEMHGGRITIRMLDVGGDKPISYIFGTEGEENPIIGLRGVRNYPVNIDVIRAQIRGILSIKPLSKIKIMIPMVTDIDEFLWIKNFILDEKKQMGIAEDVQIGTMVEVPAVALIAESMAKYADFFSIGTNDLTQYTLAMDRGNVKLAPRLNNMHPALLKLIKFTVEGSEKHNIKTAVCGAMASELQAIPLLVGLGVKELSASMKSIPDVKALIRTLNKEQCEKLAEHALTLESAQEVMEFIEKELDI